MSEPVIMEKADLAKMDVERAQFIECKVKMGGEIGSLKMSLAQALDAANRAKVEIGQLKKALPSEKMQAELKGLRAAMSEAHKRIGVLEKELAASQVETETRRKDMAKVVARFESVQGTFDTLQAARNKAQADLGAALDAVGKSAEAYHKLSAEFDAFKKAVAEAKQPQQQKQAKVQEPAKV